MLASIVQVPEFESVSSVMHEVMILLVAPDCTVIVAEPPVVPAWQPEIIHRSQVDQSVIPPAI